MIFTVRTFLLCEGSVAVCLFLPSSLMRIINRHKEKRRNHANYWWKWVACLLLVAVVIKITSFHNAWVEKYYSRSFYPFVSVVLRTVTSRVPFSLGDALYAVAAVYFLIVTGRFVKTVVQKKMTKAKMKVALAKTICGILAIYIVFNLLWGLNYNRLGIAYQLGIEPKPIITGELKSLTVDLVKAVNNARNAPGMYTFQLKDYPLIVDDAAKAYEEVQLRYPFLAYDVPNVKAMLFNRINDRLGIVGYYNPFTAEAQVNSLTPRYVLPYILLHEIAHSVGYADEAEANFVAYLAAKASDEYAFRYSAYFVLFNYANRLLYEADSVAAKVNDAALDSLVKLDETAYIHFAGNPATARDSYSAALYGDYLSLNHQPNGMATYEQVIGWIIAYQKTYGEL